MTSVPLATTRFLNCSIRDNGSATRHKILAASTSPYCPMSFGNEQASPSIKLTLDLSYVN